MIVIDLEGQKREYAYAKAKYNCDLILEPGAQFAAEVLRENEGNTAVVVTVLNKEGFPMEHIPVVWYWPDAPICADCGHFGRGQIGYTNARGVVGFGMGGGAYYEPQKGPGPHAVWIKGKGVSDAMNGLGMLFMTNHIHLDVTFVEIDGAPDPGPDPGPDPVEGDCAEAVAKLGARLYVVEQTVLSTNVLLQDIMDNALPLMGVAVEHLEALADDV